jgi:hypothetical protein
MRSGSSTTAPSWPGSRALSGAACATIPVPAERRRCRLFAVAAASLWIGTPQPEELVADSFMISARSICRLAPQEENCRHPQNEQISRVPCPRRRSAAGRLPHLRRRNRRRLIPLGRGGAEGTGQDHHCHGACRDHPCHRPLDLLGPWSRRHRTRSVPLVRATPAASLLLPYGHGGTGAAVWVTGMVSTRAHHPRPGGARLPRGWGRLRGQYRSAAL